MIHLNKKGFKINKSIVKRRNTIGRLDQYMASKSKYSGSEFSTAIDVCDFSNANKANLRDLIAATGLVISNWIQIVNFSARVTVKFDG